MKPPISPRWFLPFWLSLVAGMGISGAATIQIQGVVEGPNSGPVGTVGQTMDYLVFQVLTTSTVQIWGNQIGGRKLDLAAYVGQTDTFGFIGNPYQLVDNYPSPTPPLLERNLEAGIYVIAVEDDENSDYDWGDGFVAVNPHGGVISSGTYAFEVIGDVQGLEFWEGQLDPQPYGSFKITTLPEPSAVLTLAFAAIPLALRRRRSVTPCP